MTDTVGRIGVAVVIGFIGLVVLRALFGAVSGIIQLAWFVITIVALVDVIGSSRSVASKALWVAIILILPVVGLIAYLVVGRKG